MALQPIPSPTSRPGFLVTEITGGVFPKTMALQPIPSPTSRPGFLVTEITGGVS